MNSWLLLLNIMLHVLIICSFLFLRSIPWYGYVPIIYLLTCIWVVSGFCLLELNLYERSCTSVCVNIFFFSFLLGKYQVVEWLDHMVDMCLMPNCFPKWFYHFTYYSVVHWHFSSSTYCPYLVSRREMVKIKVKNKRSRKTREKMK